MFRTESLKVGLRVWYYFGGRHYLSMFMYLLVALARAMNYASARPSAYLLTITAAEFYCYTYDIVFSLLTGTTAWPPRA